MNKREFNFYVEKTNIPYDVLLVERDLEDTKKLLGFSKNNPEFRTFAYILGNESLPAIQSITYDFLNWHWEKTEEWLTTKPKRSKSNSRKKGITTIADFNVYRVIKDLCEQYGENFYNTSYTYSELLSMYRESYNFTEREQRHYW